MFQFATNDTTVDRVRMLLAENPFGPSGSIDEQLLATDLPLDLTRCKTLKEAMRIMREGGFDVVLLDTELFDEDFPEALHDAIRAADPASVVMIADEDDSRLTTALRAGATDFLMRDDVSAEALRRAAKLHGERRLAALERRLLYRIPSLMAETHDVRTGLTLAIAELCDGLGFSAGEVWLPRSAGMYRKAHWAGPVPAHQSFARRDVAREIPFEEGLVGRTWKLGEPVRADDLGSETPGRCELLARQVGLHAAIGMPLRHVGRPVGVMVLFAAALSYRTAALDALIVAAGQIGATLAGLVAEEELASASRQLDAAAQAVEGALIVLDDRDEILFASDDARRMLENGRPLAGRRLPELGWTISGGGSAEAEGSVPTEVIRTGESASAFIEVPNGEGGIRVPVDIGPLHGTSGDIRYAVCRVTASPASTNGAIFVA